MSRLKRFTRSLVAGYVQLGANVFYTLASVPLALHYLDKAEFGLWALTVQLGGYILLIDMGMSGSVSRILIDHKDDRQSGAYGSVIKTGALVGAVQAILIILAGTLFSLLAGPLLHVPGDLQRDFVWLMIGQSVLLGLNFASRIFSNLLLAHQRLDVGSYGASVFFFLNLAAMWWGFATGLGVFSLLVGQTVMTLGSIAVFVIGCIRLELFPRSGEWGHVSRARFRELFAFGQGIFLISLGNQLIGASQTVLLTRFLGLETAAIWAVCTRAYNMAVMVVWRIADYSAPALSEMLVRGEHSKLLKRFRDMAVLMSSLGLFCGVIFATANGVFVQLWTHGKIHWAAVNDVLLGLSFFTGTLLKVHSYFINVTKDLRFLRYIFLVEGLVFVGLNLLASRIESITLLLVFSLICKWFFSTSYCLIRTRNYFNLSRGELLRWVEPSARLAVRLIPVALATWWLGLILPPVWQFVLNLAVPGVWGGLMFLRHGLEPTLRSEMVDKFPSRIQPILRSLASA